MRERKHVWWATLTIIVVCFALFSRAITFRFVTFDDATLVYRNPLLVNLSWNSLVELWRKPFAHLYIPVGQSVWAMAAWLAHKFHFSLDTAPFIFHALNVIFHALNGLLLFGLMRRLSVSIWAAVIGVLFFLVHPLQVESVAWVSAFRQVLAVFFCLIATHCYFFMRFGVLRVFVFLLAFFLSILSQPTTVVFPLLLPLLSKVFKRGKTDWISVSGALFLGVVAIALTKAQQPTHEIAGILSFWKRPIVMFDAFYLYLTRVFLPFGLSTNYGRTPEVAIGSSFYLYGLVSTLLFVVMFFRSKWRTIIAFAFIWFFISILPTSGLIPFYFQKYSTVGDRYAYLGLMGVALAISVWVEQIEKRSAKIGVVILLVLLFWRSQDQLRHWQDDTTVVAQVARVAPSPDHRYNLAQMIVLEMEGQAPVPGLAPRVLSPPKNADERKVWLRIAELNCHEAIRMRWEFPEAWALLGSTHIAQGKYIEAVAAFQIALQQLPTFTGAAKNLAMTYEMLDRQDLISSIKTL